MPRLALALSLTVLLAAAAVAQEPDALSVSGPFAEGWVPRDEPIALTLSRPVPAAEARLAILIGATDVTSLFRVSGTVLTYGAEVPLPSGENEVVVQLVTPAGEWKEVARLPLRVLTRRGYRTARATPAVETGVKAQFREGHTPESNVPPRETFEDVTLQAGLETEHARAGWGARTRFGLVGSSYIQEALRFAQRGEKAPKLDLSGYSVELNRGRATLDVGDLSFGRHRYLVESFGSRGTQIRVGLGPRLDASLSAMSGSRIVGWDNFLGVSRPEHRMVAGTVGVELLPRQGGLRLEVSGVDGRVQPEASYNQGLVNDAASGRGVGVHVQANTLKQRLRLDGGIAWSEFANPRDPALEQGVATVPVVEVSKDARFVAVNLDVLQNHMVTPSRPATLTLSYQHDRVDPLFGSIAAVVKPDLRQDAYGVTAALGEVTARFSHARAEDNLDDVASILKTFTRRDVGSASLPLSAFRKDALPSPWLPVLSYSLDRTRQFGAGVPENSDFAPGHVPDQVSVNHVGAATWTADRVSFAYRLTRTTQDNQQPGRENADFHQGTHGLTLTLMPRPSFTLSLDASFERALNQETGREDRLQRYGVNLDFRPLRSLGLTGILSFSRGEDDKETAFNRNTELDAQVFWLFRPRGEEKRPQGRLFVRYATQRARNRDLSFFLDDERAAWQLSTGLSVNLF